MGQNRGCGNPPLDLKFDDQGFIEASRAVQVPYWV